MLVLLLWAARGAWNHPPLWFSLLLLCTRPRCGEYHKTKRRASFLLLLPWSWREQKDFRGRILQSPFFFSFNLQVFRAPGSQHDSKSTMRQQSNLTKPASSGRAESALLLLKITASRTTSWLPAPLSASWLCCESKGWEKMPISRRNLPSISICSACFRLRAVLAQRAQQLCHHLSRDTQNRLQAHGSSRHFIQKPDSCNSWEFRDEHENYRTFILWLCCPFGKKICSQTASSPSDSKSHTCLPVFSSHVARGAMRGDNRPRYIKDKWRWCILDYICCKASVNVVHELSESHYFGPQALSYSEPSFLCAV